MTLIPIRLRILHLSDIHFREAAGIDARAKMIQRETPRRVRVMAGEAWWRNLSELLDDGAIDLVCITGDVADWGSPAEFELGARFVEQLLEALSLPRERLFVVPGNHDVDRRIAEAAWAGIRGQTRMGSDELSDWMAGGPTPAGVDAAWCDRVLERQAAFRAWVERDLGRAELLPSRSPHGRLGYRVEVGAALGLHVPVWLLGLDTAWLAGSDGDAGKLRLTKDQLLMLGTDAQGQPLEGFRVAMGHHPLGELADASEARQLLAEHVDVYLHGHQHQPASALFVDPDRRLLELAAGCVFEGSRKDEHPNGLSVLTVALDDRGRPQRGELRFRSWSPRGGFWHDDSSLYRSAKHGRLELAWPGVVETPRERAGPARVWAPKVAPSRLRLGASKLFGRDDEIAFLDAAWADAGIRVVTIVAWGGVGKTALVIEWRNRLLARSEAEMVFDWSFYSQGTRDRGAVSAAGFIDAALRFFGDAELADTPQSGWEKGTRLAELVGARRSLLILDGLEPLQYPEDSRYRVGGLKEDSIVALLKGLAGHNQGLCLVTTRVAVAELAGFEGSSARRRELGKLSDADGATFMASLLGSQTSSQDQLEEISREVRGHALTLQLLSSYLRRSKQDVCSWREIDFRRADEVQGGHAFRVMDAYVTWLEGAGVDGQEQLALLRLMGLFDRPADPGCIDALRAAPAIAGLTDVLVGVDREGWALLISSLEELDLLTSSAYEAEPVVGYDEASAKSAGERGQPREKPKRWPLPAVVHNALVLDAHPLVRQYFGDERRRTNEAGWREGNRRLFEYLCGSVPYWPEGLDGLQPLYQAVVHGCAAGRVREACMAVYRDRILRGPRFYSKDHLGAFSNDLSAVACFFEGGWDHPSPALTPADQAWVLSDAAVCLRAVGRLNEALEPMREGLKLHVALEHWMNAASAASNLSVIELTLGSTRAAVDGATRAVEYADRSQDLNRQVGQRLALANSQFTLGHDVRELYEQAEEIALQAGFAPRLQSVGGHQYCELLMYPVERAAWRGTHAEPELLEVCSAVFERAMQTLEWATLGEGALLPHALDHLTLGRAALYATLLRPEASIVTGPELTLASARDHLETAVAGLRKAGTFHHLPRGLTTRAWLAVLEGQPNHARALLDEAWQLAERGPMPLHQADIQLHRARLFHDREALAHARELINKHEYGRRLPTLDDTEHVLALADDLHDRLRTSLDLNEHRATIALVIAPLGLIADVEQARDRLALDPSKIASWVIDTGPRAHEQITALNRGRDTLLTEKRLIWLRGSTSKDARFVRRAAPDLTASIDVFVDLRVDPEQSDGH